MRSTILLSLLLPPALLLLAPASLHAGLLYPDFAGAPGSWTVNRYAPHQFSNVGSYQGKQDVIALGIHSAEGFDNRLYPFNNNFYNTQGMQYDIFGGPGSSFDLFLYVPSAWSNAASGHRRTDAWAALPISGPPSDDYGYGIAGFTNYGGDARYRVWNNQIGWVDLADTVLYDQWTNFNILFTGSSLEYRVNGSLAHTDVEVGVFDGISSLTLMGYNFYNDPSITDAVANDYTAYWAATPTPEPGSWALIGIGCITLAAWKRRRR